MKNTKTVCVAAASLMMAAAAEAAPVHLNSTDMPVIVENYVENIPVEESVKTFIPEEMTNISMLPPEMDIVEFEIDPEDGISEEEVMAALESLQGDIADYARRFLGTRYVWGAKGPKAFDCSGFTGYVFKNFGYDIGSCSRVQATRGEKVDIKDARVGDLMFFSRPKGGKTVGHVGMVIDVNPDDGSLKFIHASTRKGVTIQNFPDSGHYNRRFLQVRRVIDETNLA